MIKIITWSFITLWNIKKINKKNRLLLWKKSVGLFIVFLAFTDKYRPYQQKKSAMTCAVLSAVYDYETDWVRIDAPQNALFKSLLDLYIDNEQAKQIAWDLFIKDWSNKLSYNGLERGSYALIFYNLVIKSVWMSEYTNSEILEFGRNLQILDDLLDLEEDKQFNNKNCFLMKQIILSKQPTFHSSLFIIFL